MPTTLSTPQAPENTPQKPKNKRFKKLLDHTIGIVLIASCIPVGLNMLDMKIKDNFEDQVLPARSLSTLAQNIKNNIVNTEGFAKDFFKNTEYETVAQKVNVKTRDNYSLADFLWNRNEYSSNGAWHYVNIPTHMLEEEIKEARVLQNIQKTGLANNIPGTEVIRNMIEYMKNNDSRSVMTNLFLNYEEKDDNKVIDFLLFHEFAHNIVHSTIEQKRDELSGISKNNKITTKNNNLISFEETACDVMSILMLAKRHNMNEAETLDFLDKQVALRFSTRQTILQAQKSTGKQIEGTHDTEGGLYLLKQFIKDNNIEKLKSMPVSDYIKISVALAEKNFHIIQVADLNKPNPQYENVAAQAIGLEKEDLFIFLDNLDYAVINIAKKNSLFFKTEGTKTIAKASMK